MPITQAATGAFYAPTGEVNRLNDRLFVGAEATKHNGRNEVVQADWLTTYLVSLGGARNHGHQHGALVAALSYQDVCNVVLGASRTSDFDFGAAGGNGIGILGVALNNAGTNRGAYAGYFEAFREAAAGGPTYGVEIDIANRGSLANLHPFIQLANQTVALQLASGAEVNAGLLTDSSAAINIRENGSRFLKGIIFGHDSLTGANGVTGEATAMALARGHKIEWFNAGGALASGVKYTGHDANNALTQEFSDNAVNWVNKSGKIVAQIAQYPGAACFVSLRSTPSTAQIMADSQTAGDVDIQLVPKGSGMVHIGHYGAGALTATGYITVKDSAGNVRRLLVG